MNTPPPDRRTVGSPTGGFRVEGSEAPKTEACTEQSTCWPTPLRDRSASATRAPTTASQQPCIQAWGSVVRTGGRSGSPVTAICPLAATSVRSVASQSALGPRRPKGVIATVTSAGSAAARASRTATSDGEPAASTTSAPATSSATSSGPDATTERLPRL